MTIEQELKRYARQLSDEDKERLQRIYEKTIDLPTYRLRDIIARAWEMAHEDSGGSPTFSEHLEQLLIDEI